MQLWKELSLVVFVRRENINKLAELNVVFPHVLPTKIFNGRLAVGAGVEQSDEIASVYGQPGDDAVINNRRRNPQYGGSYSSGENRKYLGHVLLAMCRFGGADIALHHPAMLNMSAFGDADIESFRSQYLTKR